jgi:hypothetical protein
MLSCLKMRQAREQSVTAIKQPVYQRSTFLRAQVAAQVAVKLELTADPLLSLPEFAAATGNPSYSRIRTWIRTGLLHTWRASPRSHHQVRLSELRRFLSAGNGERKAP